jgi:hypothetical protein
MRLTAVWRLTLVAATIATGLLAAGVGLYLAAFLVTVCPAPTLAAVRADYEPAWNRANALRTGLSVAAFALLVGAVASDRRPGRTPQATATHAVVATH